MPHALSMPAPGFQAIILCGPGSSFPTFTANPDENPKALIPIANRPMVWYPIDFCYLIALTSKSNFFIFFHIGPNLIVVACVIYTCRTFTCYYKSGLKPFALALCY